MGYFKWRKINFSHTYWIYLITSAVHIFLLKWWMLFFKKIKLNCTPLVVVRYELLNSALYILREINQKRKKELLFFWFLSSRLVMKCGLSLFISIITSATGKTSSLAIHVGCFPRFFSPSLAIILRSWFFVMVKFSKYWKCGGLTNSLYLLFCLLFLRWFFTTTHLTQCVLSLR